STVIVASLIGNIAAQTGDIRQKGSRRKRKETETTRPEPVRPSSTEKQEQETENRIIRGTIRDVETGEALGGAIITILGTSIGTVADFDGSFELKNVPEGKQILQASFVGYLTQKTEAEAGKTIEFSLSTNSIGLKEIEIISSIAKERQTPVAVTTVNSVQLQERLGAQEITQSLKFSPSVYTTRVGGGFGDSRINVRGFDQKNIGVLINGIPVNDMVNGEVYWSNWVGLKDVARNIQLQRGLGASRLAINSIGGTMNFITNTVETEKGGSLSLEHSNEFGIKYGLSLSTGKLANGWAATFSGSRTTGEGYVPGTEISAWAYFFSISKDLGTKHLLSFTILGAPQQHGQRFSRQTISTFGLRGNQYNADWGYKNGQKTLLNVNSYHKPQMTLNHYWTISDKTNLSTSAYLSFGQGWGTGLTSKIRNYRLPTDYQGQINWDAVVAQNAANRDTLPLTAGGTIIGNSSLHILRKSVNNHTWYGVLSTLTHRFTENLILTAGIDMRAYASQHFREVHDLLGGDFFADSSDKNNLSRAARIGDRID
ncbi:MAG: TonB-dependent receptor, partial [Bacteroidia bacterium]|nr:TonB-dependent receptor [Bacteroidia bacterium]